MAKYLEIDPVDGGETGGAPPVNPAPYGYKADGTAKRAPGRPSIPQQPVHAAAPVRRNNPRPPPRQSNRETVREPVRQNASVLGRDGEELRRMRPDSGGDIFERVKAPPGWDFQWNAISALNKELEEINKGISLDMYENGWRPVPASRFPGVYHPPGYDGAIIVKGMRLEERPLTLTKEARREDETRAKSQLRDQTDALRLTQQKLPGANASRAKDVSGMRMSIDKSFEVPPDENYDLE
jgi:hypothetical protein